MVEDYREHWTVSIPDTLLPTGFSVRKSTVFTRPLGDYEGEGTCSYQGYFDM